MLTASDVSKRRGDRLILDRVSFTVNRGERIGLVGPNGAGKSTLLAILAGEAEPDGGAVGLAPGARVALLHQGVDDPIGITLGGLVARVSRRVGALLAAHGSLETAAADLAGARGDSEERSLLAYDTALAAIDAKGGYAALDELNVLLAALGLADVPMSAAVDTLSGGQKTRAGLAALLADRPDLLLLDEPTNHLDIDALDWLAGYLAVYRGAILVVSHDRAFLDRTVTTVLELDDVTRRVTSYVGNYTAYATTKRRAAEAHADAYERQQREVARIERDIRQVASHARSTEGATQHDFLRGRAKKVARTAKVRERKLERALASEDRLAKPERRWGLALDFGDRSESGRDVVVADGVGVELGGRTVLRGIDLHVRHGERIALTGPNGGGKSTLLRVLVGDLVPTTGRVRLGPSVVPGWYTQEQETIDPERSVLDQARGVAARSESETRSFLHRYLFGGETVFQRARDLSYGERSRLALALLALRGANALFLDEPLNHLDLPSRERFEEALAGFDGTVMIVLHDRYAIERLATRVVVMRDGRLDEAG